ncbi:hypothetical protein [Lentzea sp. NPDC060358]|uniref:hypothetical protein n=1 Tax=Lentzea sp. NPDC060358 TaxID=3347103 RepID=UPI00364995AC
MLAEPCGVEVPDYEIALALFEGLAREAVLVDEHTIVHRKDVRQLMLRRLSEDSRERVNAIHRAAVDLQLCPACLVRSKTCHRGRGGTSPPSRSA